MSSCTRYFVATSGPRTRRVHAIFVASVLLLLLDFFLSCVLFCGLSPQRVCLVGVDTEIPEKIHNTQQPIFSSAVIRTWGRYQVLEFVFRMQMRAMYYVCAPCVIFCRYNIAERSVKPLAVRMCVTRRPDLQLFLFYRHSCGGHNVFVECIRRLRTLHQSSIFLDS